VRRALLRVGGVLVLAALLIGPSAQARAPQTADHPVRPAFGHTTSEWLMMGPNCGSSMTSG
jgi:hypothetical protein